MWTMRLRRTGRGRGQRGAARLALPTAAPFAHMTTAFSHEREPKHGDNQAPVTFAGEATRAAKIVDAGQARSFQALRNAAGAFYGVTNRDHYRR